MIAGMLSLDMCERGGRRKAAKTNHYQVCYSAGSKTWHLVPGTLVPDVKTISSSHEDCGLDCNPTSRILHCHINQLSNEIKIEDFYGNVKWKFEESLRTTLWETKMHGKETFSLAYNLILVLDYQPRKQCVN